MRMPIISLYVYRDSFNPHKNVKNINRRFWWVSSLLYSKFGFRHSIYLIASFSSLLLYEATMQVILSAFYVGIANFSQVKKKINSFYALSKYFLLVCQFYQVR